MLRRATPVDVDAVASVLTAAHAAQEWQPRLHTPADDRRFVGTIMLPSHEVWVAEEDGDIVGFAAVKDGVLGHLFVHPAAQGRGVGTALLEKTQALFPDGFTLWTHQLNEQARTFYERRGLVPIEFTDGATNEEKLPDVRYAWNLAGAAR
ncbi:MAG: GNAT family N-acetyltransferase [Gaiellaceae bacterium]